MTGSERRLDHVGFTVSDLQTSVAFYRDVVGCRVLLPHVATGGTWFDMLTGNEGAAIDVALLGLGQVTLQLVAYRAGGAPGGPTGHAHVGNAHLSVEVADLDGLHARLTASGRGDPTPIVDLPAPGRRSFYVTDPDGVPVEFMGRSDDGPPVA
ncbi:MAG TPA: VOC family protein [Acidimicrobiales bacterium]|nr:VOC family protein [Acidimicrobiales bacterium]